MTITTNIIKALTVINTLFGWLEKRGINRVQTQALLDLARAENRDITDEEVSLELHQTQSRLDETKELLAEVFPDLIKDVEEITEDE